MSLAKYTNIAQDVLFIIFDVETSQSEKLEKRIKWNTPANKTKPGAGNYEYVVITDIRATSAPTSKNLNVDFMLVSSWVHENQSLGTSNGGLSERIASRKKI